MEEIRLCGSGGQGLITAGIILAEAAIAEGKVAVQAQSYGPEARGGASKAEVIIDDRRIYHPKVLQADIVLAMTQEAAGKYACDLKENGIVIVDEDLVPEVPTCGRVIKVPITRLAVEKLGRDIFANIVALGVLVNVTGVVSFDSVKQAVASRVPTSTVGVNLEALLIGYEAL
jgi:2-oxoglutarate ferredoxin oxidoreductase subunit gamma